MASQDQNVSYNEDNSKKSENNQEDKTCLFVGGIPVIIAQNDGIFNQIYLFF